MKTKIQKNEKAEVSARSMVDVLWDELRKSRGWITQGEAEAAIVEQLGHEFTPADRKPMPKTGRPKWKNNLDWAKSYLTKIGLIAVRSKTKKRIKTTYIVMAAQSSDHLRMLVWARRGGHRNCMRKKCQGCGRYSPLAAKICKGCGDDFPEPTPKRYVLPLEK